MSAINKIKQTLQKHGVEFHNEAPLIPTGIDLLDFNNGIENSKGEIEIGAPLGRIIHIIGKSGSGKSTLAYKIAGAIMQNYKTADTLVYDAEAAAKEERVRKMMGISSKRFERDVMIKSTDTSSEDLFFLVNSIYKEKRDNKEKYMIDDEITGRTMYSPTIIILDSLARLIANEVQEDEQIKLGMTAATQAKINNAFFKQILGKIVKVNITFIIINHIGKNISINPMQPVQAQLNTLKADENVPGGKDALYLADLGIKLELKKKFEEDSEYGIKGYISEAQFFKSRTNVAGRKMEFIFSQSEGFLNDLTNFHYLKSKKLVGGAGKSFYVNDIPDVKFAQKNFRAVYKENEDFREKFDEYVQDLLIGLVSSSLDSDDLDDLSDESDYEDGEEEEVAPKKSSRSKK
jgi:RecA/RadA recombinase